MSTQRIRDMEILRKAQRLVMAKLDAVGGCFPYTSLRTLYGDAAIDACLASGEAWRVTLKDSKADGVTKPFKVEAIRTKHWNEKARPAWL